MASRNWECEREWEDRFVGREKDHTTVDLDTCVVFDNDGDRVARFHVEHAEAACARLNQGAPYSDVLIDYQGDHLDGATP